MLHHVIAMPVENGRRTLHGPEFRARERMFERYAEAIAWERAEPRPPAVGLNARLQRARAARSALRPYERAAASRSPCAALFPLFYVRYPPIQDLPQHLAAMRVLHDFHDPALGFARYFELDLLRTQYLAYLPGRATCSRTSPASSSRASCWSPRRWSRTPYAARSLLHALGKDGRLALLLFPLAYNAHLILGLLQLPRGDPARAVRRSRSRCASAAATRVARALGLAVLASSASTRTSCRSRCSRSASCCVGLVARPARQRARARCRSCRRRRRAVLAARSPAGQATLGRGARREAGPKPLYQPARGALRGDAALADRRAARRRGCELLFRRGPR